MIARAGGADDACAAGTGRTAAIAPLRTFQSLGLTPTALTAARTNRDRG